MKNTYTTWDQIHYTSPESAGGNISQNGRTVTDSFSLYESTVRRTRKTIQPYFPSKGPASWATETGDITWNYWEPKWDALYTFPYHPKASYFMWKMFHHANEVADRLGDFVETNLCHCGQPETCSHAYIECSIARAGWMMLNRIALNTVNYTFGPVEAPEHCPLRLKKLLKGLPNIQDEHERALLTLLTYSLLSAIEKHRYEVIEGKPASAIRLKRSFATIINTNISGLHTIAFSYQPLANMAELINLTSRPVKDSN